MELQDIIKQAAQEAAQSSLDAHGEYVDAPLAWDFITGVWADTDDERMPALVELLDISTDEVPGVAMPAAFAAAYAQEVAQ
jgi:hypothetical protein